MTINIPSGKLRHLITIQERTEVEDLVNGGYTQVWSDFAADMRAEKKSLTGRQLMNAQAARSEASVCFRFRFIPGVDATMEIVESGVRYKIVGPPVDVGDIGRWLEVMTKSIVSGE